MTTIIIADDISAADLVATIDKIQNSFGQSTVVISGESFTDIFVIGEKLTEFFSTKPLEYKVEVSKMLHYSNYLWIYPFEKAAVAAYQSSWRNRRIRRSATN